MSHLKNDKELLDKSRTDLISAAKNDVEGSSDLASSENCTYAVTVTKKQSNPEEEQAQCSEQKSFISIHSTDHLCQVSDIENSNNLAEFNIEILSLKEAFPSTSEESLSIGNDSPLQKKKNEKKLISSQSHDSPTGRSAYAPSNSKSATVREKEPIESHHSGYSDFDIPKSTLYVVGSNPGEPKMSYVDPPKKMSKTMKKFLRNLDKHKTDQGNSKTGEKAVSKLTTVRGILKDCRVDPECTGDNMQGIEEYNGHFNAEHVTLPFNIDFGATMNYTKQQIVDKNVTFNTQVVIIHFSGDLCVGQSVEALSKEKDQQARNSELRKTFLTKYNEFWTTPNK